MRLSELDRDWLTGIGVDVPKRIEEDWPSTLAGKVALVLLPVVALTVAVWLIVAAAS